MTERADVPSQSFFVVAVDLASLLKLRDQFLDCLRVVLGVEVHDECVDHCERVFANCVTDCDRDGDWCCKPERSSCRVCISNTPTKHRPWKLLGVYLLPRYDVLPYRESGVC